MSQRKMWRWIVLVMLIIVFVQGIAQGKKPKGRKKKNDSSGDSLNVVLEVFSGVRDPSWTVQQGNSHYQDIIASLDDATTYQPDEAPSKLGYQGFVVQETKQGQKRSPKLVVGSETESLQLKLLQSSPEGKLSSNVRNIVEMEIRNGNVSAVRRRRKRYAPWYNPSYWNGPAHVRDNNCYNYASTIRNNTFAQPGFGAGQPYPFRFTAQDMKRATEADGCVTQVTKKHMCAPMGPEHLIALFVYIGNPNSFFDRDFHFYRLDNNGYWSHKAGQTPATNLDGAGNYIRDPRKAVNGYLDYKFVCFMTVDRNNVTIQGYTE